MLPLEHQVDLLGVLGDATRLRLLHLLADSELSVGELTQATTLGQSRVSTHLARLREHEFVLDRKAGTSTYYRFNELAMPEPARRLWEVLRGQVDDELLTQDAERVEQVVRARSAQWPEALAGQMERHYSPGRTWDALARALLGLVSAGDVLDVGAGDGSVAEMLAPRARSITCFDLSERLLGAAVGRLAESGGRVRYVRGDVSHLPFCTASFDQVLLVNTLVHVEAPSRALSEVGRVLKPGGRFVLVTLAKHSHLAAAAQYGHRHAGFEPSWLRRRLRASGLEITQCEKTSRERRAPHFEVITCFAHRPWSSE